MSQVMQICNRCVMDSSDPTIHFDEKGNCNHCNDLIHLLVDQSENGLQSIIQKIKSQKTHPTYDCILGISGGVDSCYTAYLLKKEGLNPLLVHLNNGWNTPISNGNVEKIKTALQLDLEEFKFDLTEFHELQRAFLRSHLLDLELPTDLAIPAVLHQVAKKHGIKYIVSGGNFSSEGILPTIWGYHSMKDMKLYKHIVKKFSKVSIQNTPTFGLWDEFKYKFFHKIKTVYPLNTFNYNKEEARQFLNHEFGWEYYGGKHYESLYTGFWQAYMLPKKWNVDYRKATYSSLICSQQMTRDQALELLKNPPFDDSRIEKEKVEICEKLEISLSEFNSILEAKGLYYTDFPNNKKWIDFIHSTYKTLFKRGK
jgi:N-acetyl sugar amidotransferase